MKNSKKTSDSGRKKISDANEAYRGVRLPAGKQGSCQEKRKEDTDKCYDFTNDKVINPPKDRSNK